MDLIVFKIIAGKKVDLAEKQRKVGKNEQNSVTYSS